MRLRMVFMVGFGSVRVSTDCSADTKSSLPASVFGPAAVCFPAGSVGVEVRLTGLPAEELDREEYSAAGARRGEWLVGEGRPAEYSAGAILPKESIATGLGLG